MDKSRRGFLGLGAAAAAGWLAGCGKEAPAASAPLAAAPPAPREPAVPPAIPAERYLQRRKELASRMKEEGFDYLLSTPGASFAYLTGADLGRSERLIALVLGKDGSCSCVGPAFERERLEQAGLPGKLHTWEESEDPIPLLASLLPAAGGSSRVAVEGTTWFDDLAPLERRIAAERIASATPLLSALRMRKDPDELALMRFAASVTLEAIRLIMQEVKEGVTEKELLGRAADIASAAGAALEGTVQFGPRSAIPHAQAGGTRLRSSDVILFDLVAEVRGYHSDISRTFGFGAPSSHFQEVYRLVRHAQEEGIRAARSGVPARNVDEAARAVIRRNGYGPRFTHRLGHGLGLQVHEAPYLVGGNDLILREGMTVTVEPGIYLPGEFGVRLEDDIRVTAGDAEILSAPASPSS
jgi:Xaa-Pro dipeptidase